MIEEYKVQAALAFYLKSPDGQYDDIAHAALKFYLEANYPPEAEPPTPEECDHDWEYHPDWGGNPDIPNGTFDASYYYCPKCDTEQYHMPDGYEPPFDEPEDY